MDISCPLHRYIFSVRERRKIMILEVTKTLRKTTHAPIALCREAAERAGGDLDQARTFLDELWQAPKPKRDGDTAGQIFTYVHQGRVGVMVDVRCATDFVARTAQFQDLCKELALQVAAGLEEELPLQPYIRNPRQCVQELIEQASRQVNEPITVQRTVRWSLEDE
jgi:elongation factor Ts